MPNKLVHPDPPPLAGAESARRDDTASRVPWRRARRRRASGPRAGEAPRGVADETRVRSNSRSGPSAAHATPPRARAPAPTPASSPGGPAAAWARGRPAPRLQRPARTRSAGTLACVAGATTCRTPRAAMGGTKNAGACTASRTRRRRARVCSGGRARARKATRAGTCTGTRRCRAPSSPPRRAAGSGISARSNTTRVRSPVAAAASRNVSLKKRAQPARDARRELRVRDVPPLPVPARRGALRLGRGGGGDARRRGKRTAGRRKRATGLLESETSPDSAEHKKAARATRFWRRAPSSRRRRWKRRGALSRTRRCGARRGRGRRPRRTSERSRELCIARAK